MVTKTNTSMKELHTHTHTHTHTHNRVINIKEENKTSVNIYKADTKN